MLLHSPDRELKSRDAERKRKTKIRIRETIMQRFSLPELKQLSKQPQAQQKQPLYQMPPQPSQVPQPQPEQQQPLQELPPPQVQQQRS